MNLTIGFFLKVKTIKAFTTKKTFIRKGKRRTLITKSPRKDAINMGFAFTQL